MNTPQNAKDIYDMLGEDYGIVISRLMKDDRVEKYLKMFANSTEMTELEKAIEGEDWESAFRATHTLKGVAANLGLLKLGRLASDLCEEFRGFTKPENDYKEILEELKKTYINTTETINKLK